MMRLRVVVGALAGLTLSCQSETPVKPTAARPAARPAGATGVILAAPAVPSPTPAPIILIELPAPTPRPVATATANATITPTPTATPRPVATPAPRPADPFCLDLATVPSSPVPVFTGRSCRTSEGFLPVLDPGTQTDGCIRNWRCEDGDQRYQPIERIGTSLNTGGQGGVHRCNPGEGMGPEFICDGGRPGQEAYGRNVTDAGAIIQPAPEPNGRVPGAWERAGICRPVLCGATPRPTP